IKVESTPINHIIRHLIKLGVLLLRESQVLLNSKNENLLIVSLLYHRLVIATNFPYLDFHDAI
ncbi:hypothetical protein, partial [Phocaeicola dorei]|uniref:hypothetical protein n=1 Tax=Phocaeicola dorei TaxID=357276 RepID=UPI0032C1B218